MAIFNLKDLIVEQNITGNDKNSIKSCIGPIKSFIATRSAGRTMEQSQNSESSKNSARGRQPFARQAPIRSYKDGI